MDGFNSIRVYQWSGLLFRLGILFSIPNLSDDFYRFIWDGMLGNQGISPYLYTPTEWLRFQKDSGYEQLYHKLNSPEYYSVYTPLNQLIFELAVLIFPNWFFGQVLVLKTSIFVFEVGTIFLLPVLMNKLNIKPVVSLFYILNPLPIVELVGNIHFEALTIFFLLMFLFFFVQHRRWISYVFLALAVQIKLVPLILFPSVIRKTGFRSGLILLLVVLTINLAFIIPNMNLHLLMNFLSGIELYFQRFEFNASIYYLIREIGFQTVGYNIIASLGKILPIIVLILVCSFPFFLPGTKSHFLFSVFLALFFYYLFASTVHPWYLCPMLALSILIQMYYTMFIWSFLVYLSYYTYSTPEYIENMWLVAVEYFVVFSVFAFEFRKKYLQLAGTESNQL